MSALAFVIEDDEKIGTIFSAALNEAGYETEVIQDGSQALKRLAEATPDVVVLDLHLPHVAGSEILKQIRADARLKQTRVIIATADAAMANGELNDEADLVLIKPIRFSQMRDLAKELLPSDD